jgi:serine-type D-Ala-D-Ala endopeptidase (penicillin-binding protein 7)
LRLPLMNRLLTIVFALVLAAPAWAAGDSARDPAKLRLSSANVLILDAEGDNAIYAKAADEVTPIASVTKLMTAMVVVDAQQSMDELLEVDMRDFDFLKGSTSRLRLGATLPRREMLRLALMSSENRAASALARYYPGGTQAAVSAMNAKAQLLGLTHTHYEDPTGLNPGNVSTATDLARLVKAAADYPLIREFTTTPSQYVQVEGTHQMLGFNNSNPLVKSDKWDIQLQKTGYIREAGKCLVMMTTIASKPFVIVLLDSLGKYTRVADAQRIKHWLETGESAPAASLIGAKPPRGGIKAAAANTKLKRRVHGTFQARFGRNTNS